MLRKRLDANQRGSSGTATVSVVPGAHTAASHRIFHSSPAPYWPNPTILLLLMAYASVIRALLPDRGRTTHASAAVHRATALRTDLDIASP